jgi:hypothetical protein
MSLRTPLEECPQQLRKGCVIVMKKSSEGSDTCFPNNQRLSAVVVTGWDHKVNSAESKGRVAVKINGKGKKLWVLPSAIHSGKRAPRVELHESLAAAAAAMMGHKAMLACEYRITLHQSILIASLISRWDWSVTVLWLQLRLRLQWLQRPQELPASASSPAVDRSDNVARLGEDASLAVASPCASAGGALPPTPAVAKPTGRHGTGGGPAAAISMAEDCLAFFKSVSPETRALIVQAERQTRSHAQSTRRRGKKHERDTDWGSEQGADLFSQVKLPGDA